MAVKVAIRTASRRMAEVLRETLDGLSYVETVTEPRVVPPSPPAQPAPIGYFHGWHVVIPSLLTFLQDGVIVIQGTETAGINFAQDGVDIITLGTGTVDVLEDGA
jgi:hypothetical protein